jgi:hypothetical protein
MNAFPGAVPGVPGRDPAPGPGRGYAMVPAWLAWKQPSPNALLVYVHLALFGTFNPGTATYEQCRPSKKTLAKGDPDRKYKGTGLSESTVGRALRELERLGGIVGEPSFDEKDGSQGPTVYRVVFGAVVEEVSAPESGQTAGQQDERPAHRQARRQAARRAVDAAEPDPGVTGDTPSVYPGEGSVSAGQPPLSDSYPPRGIADDTGGVSNPIPPPGYGSDTQPITHYQEPNTQTPHSPPPVTSPSAPAEAPGGRDSSKSRTKQPDLDKVVAWFGKRRPDWESRYPGVIRASLVAAVEQNLGDLTASAAALLELAEGKHGTTRSPKRLLWEGGAWWTSANASRGASGGLKATSGPVQREPCPLHPGQPEGNCGPCRGTISSCGACQTLIAAGETVTSCSHVGEVPPPLPDDPEAAKRTAAYLARYGRGHLAGGSPGGLPAPAQRGETCEEMREEARAVVGVA